MMKHEILRLNPYFASIVAICRWLLLAVLSIFIFFVAVRAISESWINDSFPEALAIKLELLPFIFPLHMITGGLALLLVPLTLYLRHTAWHRMIGRVTAADILVAGMTAIPVALDVPVTIMSAAGFTAQALTWMTLLILGVWHIRQGHIAQHRACMLMMAAVTSGALFFRIYLGVWKVLGVSKYFTTFYAIDAWIAWGLPLAVTVFGLWFSTRRDKNTHQHILTVL
jgi:uncharacterized membrane protein YozB (DUF420 family)